MRAGLVASLIVLAAAGCGGGSKAPSVASLGTTGAATTPSTTTPKASFVAFAACMQRHGVQATSPGGHGVEIQGTPGGRAQAAMEACRSLLPGGGPPQLSPAQQALRARSLATLAVCMRKHGVTNFPDEVNPDTMQNVDPESPVFRTAYKACWSLYPRVGPQIRLGP